MGHLPPSYPECSASGSTSPSLVCSAWVAETVSRQVYASFVDVRTPVQLRLKVFFHNVQTSEEWAPLKLKIGWKFRSRVPHHGLDKQLHRPMDSKIVLPKAIDKEVTMKKSLQIQEV